MSSQNYGPLPESAISDSAVSRRRAVTSPGWETGLLTSVTGGSCLWVVGRPSPHNYHLKEPTNWEREGGGWHGVRGGRTDNTQIVPGAEAVPDRSASAFQ